MSRSKKSINNLKFAIIGQCFGFAISFIARIVFIKYLGSEYLGLNGLFTNILSVLSLAELGIGEAINFSLYKPLAENDKYKCKMLMQFYKKTYISIGCIILFLGLIITPFLSFFINDLPSINNIRIIYILFVINTSISYFFSYKRNLIIADQNRYIATIYRYTFYFILNVVQIIWLIITHNYIGFLICQILNTFLENLFVSKKADSMYSYLKDTDNIELDKNTKSEIKKNTKAMMMHKIGGIVVSSTDNILISKYVGLVAVGLYSNYVLILTALNSIFSQFYNSIIASVGNLFAIDDSGKQYDIFKKIDFIGFLLYSFSFCCLICLFNPFITIWLGEKYLFDQKIVLIIVVNFYITGMRKSNMTFREASGLFYKDRWKAILEATVNLIVSIVLVIKYGVLGIFLGTFISSLTTCLWIEPLVLYKYGFKKKLSLYFIDYIKYALFTIVITFISYYLCSKIIAISIYSLIIKGTICCAIFTTGILVFYNRNDNYLFFKKMIKDRMVKIKKGA